MADVRTVAADSTATEVHVDLVCNIDLFQEKYSAIQSWKSGCVNLQSAALTVSGFVLFLLIIALVGIPFISQLLYPCMPLLLFGSAGLLFLIPILSLIREFPTNFNITDHGIFFVWRKHSVRFSDYIPWDCISRVSMQQVFKPNVTDAVGTGSVLLLDINPRMMSWFKQFHLYLHTQSLWRSGLPFATAGFLPQISILRLQFPLDALTLDSDKERLLSAIERVAPPSAKTPEFKQFSSCTESVSYTELWLDDMKSFRRTRVHELQVGEALQEGKYQIFGRIATGGQAKIYRSCDTTSGASLVLKEMVLPVQAGTETRNRSFENVRREAALLAKLNHSHIIKLIDHFVEDHRAYLVLEPIDGKSLRKHVQDGGPLPPELVTDIAIQMSDVLTYLHSQSPPVVHRDISPDNFMLQPSNQIKLLDFNVAHQLESTATQTVVGKHNYIAPEQFKGKPCPQSDLYSLGATLYFILTALDPQPITCSRPSAITAVPTYLDDAIARLTSLDLATRYKSATELKTDLTAR
jgi:tRNA A-37 threonylcarbamoyl transferase component Bud32